jgi:hypothetical protein
MQTGANHSLPLWKPARMHLLKVPSQMILSCKSASTMLAPGHWAKRAWRHRQSMGLDIVRMLCNDMTFHVSRLRRAMRTALDWTGV